MLFSFLSLPPATVLKLRRKKAESKRLTRQAINLRFEERLRMSESTKPDEEVVGDVLAECVEAVTEMLADQNKFSVSRAEAKEEVIEAQVEQPKGKKRRR